MVFRVTCESGKHTIAHVQVPDALLADGLPRVSVSGRCLTCKANVSTTLVPARAEGSSSPKRVAAAQA